MGRADMAVICFVLMTVACLSVVFVWSIWQQVLINDLQKGTASATTTTASTTTAAPTTAPAPTGGAVAGVGEFQQRIAVFREQVIDPLLVKRNVQDAPARKSAARVITFPTKAPPVPPKPVFAKQVQPEKVVPLKAAFGEAETEKDDSPNKNDDVKEQSDDDVSVGETSAQSDERAVRAALAMAENEAKHKAAAAATATPAAPTAAASVKRPLSLQQRMRGRA